MVDGAPWERRTQLAGIINRLAAALRDSATIPTTVAGQELVDAAKDATELLKTLRNFEPSPLLRKTVDTVAARLRAALSSTDGRAS
jgi:hypothetical protein